MAGLMPQYQLLIQMRRPKTVPEQTKELVKTLEDKIEKLCNMVMNFGEKIAKVNVVFRTNEITMQWGGDDMDSRGPIFSKIYQF